VPLLETQIRLTAATPVRTWWLGACRCRRVAKHVAATPHGFDVVTAAGRVGELFAELADEDIDDLGVRLVCSVIKLVEKHILREDDAFAQTEELKNGILLASQWHRLIIDKDSLGTEIDDQRACPDLRFGRALETRHDRLNADCVIYLKLGQPLSPQRNQHSTNVVKFQLGPAGSR